MTDKDPYQVYFAGELFSLKHLVGNALLADCIHQASEGKFRCALPQNYEQREATARIIRNRDIRFLIESDLGLFHFDGTELDSGTVVEFMVAKFMDIPAVIVRGDFRDAGDNEQTPWNLMLSNYPRSEIIHFNAIAYFQDNLKQKQGNTKDLVDLASQAVEASLGASKMLAEKIVTAFDKLLQQEPLLMGDKVESVYSWARTMPGGAFHEELTAELLDKIIARKRARGLLGS